MNINNRHYYYMSGEMTDVDVFKLSNSYRQPEEKIRDDLR